jgi:hypothetical protein
VSNAAIVEKARSLYESREAIYIEHGAWRVRVNRVYVGSALDPSGYMAFDLEEIPTPGLPVWLRDPRMGPHPHRWTVGAPFEIDLFPHYCGTRYPIWSMCFSPKLVAEVVEMATNFAGDNSRELYGKICRIL